MSTRKGKIAETKAARYLRRHGYTILARNIRLGRGELDIVARQGDILAFIEVKQRKTREDGLLSMHEDKCSRVSSAAAAYVAQHKSLTQLQCRFDLIILTPGRIFSHIEHLQDVIR